MAKISNYVQKSFAGAVPPTDVLSIFGALKAGYTPSNSYSSNIETLQSLPAWSEGLNSAMMNYYNPTIQDMNTLFHVPSRQIRYCKQAGIPEWKANITYYTGSIVSDGLGSIYRSLVEANLNQPFTDYSKWSMVDSIKITYVGTSNYTALNTDQTIIWSLAETTASSRTITIPAATTALIGKRYYIRNFSGSPSYPMITTISGGSNIGYSTTKNVLSIICVGSHWQALVDEDSGM